MRALFIKFLRFILLKHASIYFSSSSSITELREIFEQAESRRQSREENNNVIRTSVNNLSSMNNSAVITNETAEDGDIWSNTREDIVHDFRNDNEMKPLEPSQR